MVFRETFSSPSLPDWTAPVDGCYLFIRVGAAPAGSAHLSCLVPSLPFPSSTYLALAQLLYRKLLLSFPGSLPSLPGLVYIQSALATSVPGQFTCQEGDRHNHPECTLPFPANSKPFSCPPGVFESPQSQHASLPPVATSRLEYPSAALLLGSHSSLERWKLAPLRALMPSPPVSR